jgi:multiple sugar transport system permease protein
MKKKLSTLMAVLLIAAVAFSGCSKKKDSKPDTTDTSQTNTETAAIDGIRNRTQEIFYITIPSMKPQMLFGGVMSVVNTFNVSTIGVQLSGENPTPRYAGQLIVTHIEDFGFIRYEMGYAAALSVVLLLFVYWLSKLAFKLFLEKD